MQKNNIYKIYINKVKKGKRGDMKYKGRGVETKGVG